MPTLTRTGRCARWGRIAVLVCLLPAACSQKQEVATTEPPVRVQVATATLRTLSETVRGIGTLRAAKTVEVRPEIAGRVTAVRFDEGRRVKDGELLFELDTRKLERELASRRAALAAAQARLANAERELDRLDRLYRQKVTTEDARDQAATNLAAAQADVQRLQSDAELAEEQLADARIYAPFAGRISDALVDVGDYVQAGALLATLYQADELEIEFTLPERYMGRVEVGQPVSLTVSAYPDRTFTATTTFVSPSVDDRTRDFLVKAGLHDPRALLKPGTFATALLTVQRAQNVVVIPEEALIATREGYMVFVVDETRHAVRRPVQIGLRKPGIVEITQGLAAGERVVRTGHLRVADGSLLSIAEPDPDDPADPDGASDGTPAAARATASDGAPASGTATSSGAATSGAAAAPGDAG